MDIVDGSYGHGGQELWTWGAGARDTGDGSCCGHRGCEPPSFLLACPQASPSTPLTWICSPSPWASALSPEYCIYPGLFKLDSAPVLPWQGKVNEIILLLLLLLLVSALSALPQAPGFAPVLSQLCLGSAPGFAPKMCPGPAPAPALGKQGLCPGPGPALRIICDFFVMLCERFCECFVNVLLNASMNNFVNAPPLPNLLSRFVWHHRELVISVTVTLDYSG